jgi:hypothetical protein
MVNINGLFESSALLQVWGVPPNAPPTANFSKLGTHAIAFSGVVDLQEKVCTDEVSQKRANLNDVDDPFTWDLDITVGPDWRKIAQVAPLVVVTDIFSSNADGDDNFEAGVEFRAPPWTASTTTPKRIVLHVTVRQAGEFLNIHRLNYTVTATGDLFPSSLSSIVDKIPA